MEGFLVREVLGSLDPGHVVSEWVTIDWQDCARRRFRVITDHGTPLGIDLPEGQGLSHGDVVYQVGSRIIAVRVRPTGVLVATPASVEQMGRAAYHIGNLHQPCLVQGETLVVLDDPVPQNVLDRLQVPYVQAQKVLEKGFTTNRLSDLTLSPHHD